ncbi:MAG: hemolysin III family protein [Bacteroidota bacterium]
MKKFIWGPSKRTAGSTLSTFDENFFMKDNDKFSPGEELANAISHLTGTLLAIAALILMINHSLANGNNLHLLSTAVFGTSMILLYTSSTLTHILPMGKAKDRFFNMDRIAIYILIAGTYTPIALITLNGPLGWTIFGIEWGMALVGTMMILIRPGDFHSGVNTFYVLSYAIMGWLVLIAIGPIFKSLPLMGGIWIFIGGLAYTVGIIFFKSIKFPYHHLVWHLLVIAGTVSHFIAVYFFIIPS